MNSIITTTASNSTLTMSSREIAKLTGKRHDNVISDIEKMLKDVGEDALKFKGIYLDAYKREKKCYNLPQDLTYTLVAGYRSDLRLKIVRRWMELEGERKSPPTPKPKRIRKPSFAVTFDRCLRVASHLPNVDENQKVLMAARGTYNLTGINPLEVMGYTAIPAATQDNYLTPTELGRQVGLSGRRVNQILCEEAHLQVHTPCSSSGSDWSMTEKGLAFGKMFDSTRKGGKGSQQQLKWKPSAIEFLRPFANPPA